MTLADILVADAIHLDLDAPGRREVLRALAEDAARREGGDAEVYLDALLAREKLGSTGLGKGIAIPHAPIKGLERPLAGFARLARPVDYAAADDEPVDLVLMVLMPEHSAGGEHLKVLSRAARLLREDEILAKLRSARSAEAVLALLAPPE